ncbi:hypothetical protein [Parageobacillus thermoglucosidasius]|uniref:Phospholipase A(2) n=1 Tax=Parageobacillus thermoglucosidasius TaxID=1426 RepID=A0AB38R2J3_PARTM|nr:hypothetical protein [Parageobacillus thermoglucosidasius]UOE78281.1 hypothetical protein IMI45_19835 [Parageobacillus thermoglucosidasius]
MSNSVLKGAFLSKEETELLKVQAFNDPKFIKVVNELVKDNEINPENVTVLKPIKFDVRYGNLVKSVKTATFRVEDHVYVTFFEVKNHQNGEIEIKVDGRAAVNVNEQVTLMNVYVKHHQDNVVRKESVLGMKIEEFEEFIQKSLANYDGFQHDPYYVEGELNAEVETEGFLDGCLPGGYLWCGMGCQIDSNACNGPYIFNPNNPLVDNCCRQHDCCYRERGETWPNDDCDLELCDCVRDVDPYGAASLAIQAVMCDPVG